MKTKVLGIECHAIGRGPDWVPGDYIGEKIGVLLEDNDGRIYEALTGRKRETNEPS